MHSNAQHNNKTAGLKWEWDEWVWEKEYTVNRNNDNEKQAIGLKLIQYTA